MAAADKPVVMIIANEMDYINRQAAELESRGYAVTHGALSHFRETDNNPYFKRLVQPPFTSGKGKPVGILMQDRSPDTLAGDALITLAREDMQKNMDSLPRNEDAMTAWLDPKYDRIAVKAGLPADLSDRFNQALPNEGDAMRKIIALPGHPGPSKAEKISYLNTLRGYYQKQINDYTDLLEHPIQGLEVLQIIKGDERFKSVPVVVEEVAKGNVDSLTMAGATIATHSIYDRHAGINLLESKLGHASGQRRKSLREYAANPPGGLREWQPGD